ncbi:MAG: 50S ribosomal protein L18 [Rhodothermales bacterium]
MAKNRKALSRKRIKRRIRKRINGTPESPRLSVFRSSQHIYAQLIDDLSGHTLAAASSLEDVKMKGSSVEKSVEVGKKLAERAKAAGIESAVFDRNGFRYHGRVKALAEGAREGGISF